MAETRSQDFRTHRRWDPWYHFFAAPVLASRSSSSSGTRSRRRPAGRSGTSFVAAAVVVLALKVRDRIALKDQDRIIRLEERLRLSTLLDRAAARAGAARSPCRSSSGLRFASDDELPELVQAALDENLGGEAIKKRVKIWRPDFLRV